MPIGSYSTIPVLASHLLEQRPHSILDLGVGFGMNGAVVRQWLDGGNRPFETMLSGVEAWADYRSPLWDVYDAVYVQTIQEHLGGKDDPRRFNEPVDLVLMSDVLEHFEFSEGEQVIQMAQDRLAPGGYLFISTPACEMPQGPVYGNPFEEHRSSWKPADLVRRGFEIMLSAEDKQLPPALPTLAARWRR